jgi:hypothetical protein
MPGARSAWQLNFVRRRLVFVGRQNASGFISSYWPPKILRCLLRVWKNCVHPSPGTDSISATIHSPIIPRLIFLTQGLYKSHHLLYVLHSTSIFKQRICHQFNYHHSYSELQFSDTCNFSHCSSLTIDRLFFASVQKKW